MRRTLALVAALAGCSDADPDGRSDTMRWFTWPNETELDGEAIAFVEDVYGMKFVREEEPVGAVTVYFDDTLEGELVAHASAAGLSCTPHIFIRTHTPRVLAHELGHSYGLSHADDENNVMFPALEGGLELTEDQLDEARRNAWILEEYCVDSSS